MQQRWLAGALLLTILASAGRAQDLLNPTNSYKILSTTKVGGAGGWDHIYADSDGRRLYVPRTGTGAAARILVYDLDTMKPAGTIAGVNAHAVAVDTASGHGFSASRPVSMWDSKTLKVIKTIPVQTEPEYIVFDPFKSRVYVLTREEGGRHTPFYNGYRPQFYLRTTDITGSISLHGGAEMVMPGDNVEMGVELITPIGLEVGQRFAIREGGRTVGAGAVTSIAS